MRLMIMIIDILSYIVAYAIFLEKTLLSDFVRFKTIGSFWLNNRYLYSCFARNLELEIFVVCHESFMNEIFNCFKTKNYYICIHLNLRS